MYDHYTAKDEELIEAHAEKQAFWNEIVNIAAQMDGQEFMEALMYNGFNR